jgi:hypothetical protein
VISVKIGFNSIDPKAGGCLKMIDTGGIPADEENIRSLATRITCEVFRKRS